MTKIVSAKLTFVLALLFIHVTSHAQNYAEIVKGDEPLAYWRLGDEEESFTIVDEMEFLDGDYGDQAQLGLPGAVIGDSDTSAGFSGNAESRAEIHTDAELLITPEFTVEFWVMRTGGQGGFTSPSTMRAMADSNNNRQGWTFYATTSNVWTYRIGQGTATWVVLDGPEVVDGKWTHLVGNYDGTTMSFYVDGELVSSTEASYVPIDETLTAPKLGIGFGATEGAGGFWFTGQVDEFAYYDKALTAGQVKTHYDAAMDPTVAPVILSMSPDLEGVAGDTTTLSVKTHSATPVTYQWLKDGSELEGETGMNLTVGPLTGESAGSYTVVATNAAGATTSEPTIIAVMAPLATYKDTIMRDEPVAYYRLDESEGTVASDTAGDFDGQYLNGVVFGAPGAIVGDDNPSAKFTQSAKSKVDIEWAEELNYDDFTFECWAKSTGGSSHRSPLTSRDDFPQEGYIFYADPGNTWQYWTGTGAGWNSINGPTVVNNVWYHLVGTYDSETRMKKFYVDGVEVSSNESDFAYNDTGFLRIGGGATESEAGNYYFEGFVDEVAIYDKPLSFPQIRSHFLAAKKGGSLSITSQPESATVPEFASVTLTFEAASSTDPSTIIYQWYRDGVEIPGGKSSGELGAATYTVSSVDVSYSGAKFICTASNIDGSFSPVTSDEVSLTIIPDTTAPAVMGVIPGPMPQLGTFSINFTENSPGLAPGTIIAENFTVKELGTGVELVIDSVTLVGSKTVSFNTAPMKDKTEYEVSVKGIQDVAASPNTMEEGSYSFTTFEKRVGAATALLYPQYSGAALGNFPEELRGTGQPLDGFAPFSGDLFDNFNNVATGYSSLIGYLESPQSGDISTPKPNARDNYSQHIFGWLKPSVTGNYIIAIAVDDNAELYLSTDEDPANSVLVATEPQWNANRQYDDGTKSDNWTDVIELEAGNEYWFELYMAEGGGGDNAAVAWTYATGDDWPEDPPDGIPNGATPIPGENLITYQPYLDPSKIEFAVSPTDQLAVLPSSGEPITTFDFTTGDEGFTVETVGAVPGPWEFDEENGQWVADGSVAGCGGPYHSILTTPEITAISTGGVSLEFFHRFAFEPELWDGGQLWVSVNGSDFTEVPKASIVQNGYAEGDIVGNGILKGKQGFNGKTTGYDAGVFVKTVAMLGTMSAGDTFQVQFVGGWDDCATGTNPNWVIDSVEFFTLPIISQDFSDNDGGYYVETVGAVPGPWAFKDGVWVSEGSVAGCGGPYHDFLSSPNYLVVESGEVTLSFEHRHAFEGDMWDSGQLWISVNGGDYTDVGIDAFSINGYTDVAIIGNGIAKGQNGFGNTSAGYADGSYITTIASLGSFAAGDAISVRFVALYDDCATGVNPNWVVAGVSSDQMVLGSVPVASTFTVDASAMLFGQEISVSYQWQRDDGNGFVDIPGTVDPSFKIYPVEADMAATFRVKASVLGAEAFSDTAQLKLVIDSEAPALSVVNNGDRTVTVTFEGTLQLAPTVNGPWSDVGGASPLTIPADQAAQFGRARN